jgi:hypothetical protein
MPVDRGAIDAQLREIGEGEAWWEQREFRDLPYILREGERIRGLVIGKLLGARRPRLRSPRWLIVATDQRLICLKQAGIARKQVEIAASEIARVQQGSRLRAYQIVIDVPPRRYRIRIRKADAFRFARSMAPLVPELQRQAAEAAQGAPLPAGGGVAALPGVGGLVSMMQRPTGDFATREHMQHVEAAVERLHEDVERLQRQVAFLESLLHQRADATFRTEPTAHEQ